MRSYETDWKFALFVKSSNPRQFRPDVLRLRVARRWAHAVTPVWLTVGMLGLSKYPCTPFPLSLQPPLPPDMWSCHSWRPVLPPQPLQPPRPARNHWTEELRCLPTTRKPSSFSPRVNRMGVPFCLAPKWTVDTTLIAISKSPAMPKPTTAASASLLLYLNSFSRQGQSQSALAGLSITTLEKYITVLISSSIYFRIKIHMTLFVIAKKEKISMKVAVSGTVNTFKYLWDGFRWVV